MENTYRNFYRSLYLHTGGYLTACPLNQNIYPGDFFQIRNGGMIVLGNIFRNGIVDEEQADLEYGVKLNPASWSFNNGVSKPYSGRGSGPSPTGGDFEFTKQVLAFGERGSFIFRGNDPESVRIKNWNSIQQQLIIKLTQTLYSFRELYLVTESATASAFTLAIAGADKAELEIATDNENFSLTDIFGHTSTQTIQSQNIEIYQSESKRRPIFYKAKKLAIQAEPEEIFLSEQINQKQDQNEWALQFFDYDFHFEPVYYGPSNNIKASLLDMLRANELNPNTALRYFKWADANLDDVEKLFMNYGNA